MSSPSILPFANAPVNIPINRSESGFLQNELIAFRDREVLITRVETLLIKDILNQLQIAQVGMAIAGDDTPVSLSFSQQESEFLQSFLVTWRNLTPAASPLELGYVSGIGDKLRAAQSQESTNVLQPVQFDGVPQPPNFGDFGPNV